MHSLILPFGIHLIRPGALLVALALAGCGNGGDGDRDDRRQMPPVQTDLVWDEGNWDELNWQ